MTETAKYAGIAPRIYVFKSKLLDAQKLFELSQAPSIEDFTRLLRDTRYSGDIGSASTISEVSKGITKRYFRDLAFLYKIAGDVDGEIIGFLMKLEEVKFILKLIRPVIEGDLETAKKIAKDMPVTKNIRSAVEAVLSLESVSGESKTSIVKRIIDLVEDKIIKNWFDDALKIFDSEQRVCVLEASVIMSAANNLMWILRKTSGTVRIDVKRLLCPLIDYLLIRTAANLIRATSNEQVINQYVRGCRGCIVTSTDIGRGVSSRSFLPVYSRLCEAYGIELERVGSEEEADRRVWIKLKKLIRKRCNHQFESYPFTPALTIAAALMLYIEYNDLMSILSNILVSGRGLQTILSTT